ncbi:MAG TPA: fimbrial protein [Scandinavium sp.]|uniref:fimbrial protein n=1 Tax=Scandinavium sp. TaxID=2830653 RepID=UPI002E313ED2|nr:fimbrial protein [Scandinavium sp.]HEX4502926.1 fimbrial protein [Scandinavium sp.]
MTVKAYSDENSIALNFTGTIKAASCDISSGNGQKVSLGDVGTTHFGSTGDVSSAKPFSIGLNCADYGPKQATVTFSGTAASDPTLLALDGGEGAATGIAVRINQADSGEQVKLNTPSATTALIAGENTLNFTAQYQALTGRSNITPGKANATAQFTINYP